MSTPVPGFQSFSPFLRHFVIAKLATDSMKVYMDVVSFNPVVRSVDSGSGLACSR